MPNADVHEVYVYDGVSYLVVWERVRPVDTACERQLRAHTPTLSPQATQHTAACCNVLIKWFNYTIDKLNTIIVVQLYFVAKHQRIIYEYDIFTVR